MKKVILSLALVSVTLANAQKKEISNAYKAIESGDNNTASAQLSAAESAMGDKTYLLEPEVLEQYYYTKGLTLMNAGKSQEGAVYLAKINDMGKMKIYSGKNSSKEKVYYIGKKAANQSGITDLKEDSYSPKTSEKLGQKINPILEKISKAAVDAYNSQNYLVAGEKFKETYYLLKASGTDDKTYLKNAAISYAAADKLAESIDLYNDLIDYGYTGIETTYTGVNSKTGTAEKMNKGTYDIYKQAGATSGYTDFKVETSPSIEKDLYSINAKNLYNAKRYEDAIKLADKGLAKFPADSDLMNIKGLSFYGSGKSAEFIDILKAQTVANPKNAKIWFNLGFMQSKVDATKGEAEKSFKKALEIDPKYVSAAQNLTYLKIGDEDKFRAEYEATRKAGNAEKTNKLLEDRRARVISALPYAEQWYNLKPDDLDVVSLLKNIYLTAKNDAKVAEFKAKEEALKAKQPK